MLIIYNLTQTDFSKKHADQLHQKLFSHFKIKPQHILELILVNRKIIKKLNREYLNRDEETDVLSFPVDHSHLKDNQQYTIFGSIYLCPEYIKQQDEKCKNYNSYIVHGFIHLLGYDHYSEAEQKKWSRILQKINNLL